MEKISLQSAVWIGSACRFFALAALAPGAPKPATEGETPLKLEDGKDYWIDPRSGQWWFSKQYGHGKKALELMKYWGMEKKFRGVGKGLKPDKLQEAQELHAYNSLLGFGFIRVVNRYPEQLIFEAEDAREKMKLLPGLVHLPSNRRITVEEADGDNRSVVFDGRLPAMEEAITKLKNAPEAPRPAPKKDDGKKDKAKKDKKTITLAPGETEQEWIRRNLHKRLEHERVPLPEGATAEDVEQWHNPFTKLDPPMRVSRRRWTLV